MDDIFIIEASDNVNDSVCVADVGQKLVSQALALGRTLDKAGYIHKLYDRRSVLLRLVYRRKEVKAFVRHGDHADVRLDRAERIVRALRPGVRNCIKQCGFADIRQPDDT